MLALGKLAVRKPGWFSIMAMVNTAGVTIKVINIHSAVCTCLFHLRCVGATFAEHSRFHSNYSACCANCYPEFQFELADDDAVFTYFNERGIDCHAYDMRTFGQSEPDDKKRGMILSYEESIADLVAFAKHVKGKISPLPQTVHIHAVAVQTA